MIQGHQRCCLVHGLEMWDQLLQQAKQLQGGLQAKNVSVVQGQT